MIFLICFDILDGCTTSITVHHKISGNHSLYCDLFDDTNGLWFFLICFDILDGCTTSITVHHKISDNHSLNCDLGDEADTKKPDTFNRHRVFIHSYYTLCIRDFARCLSCYSLHPAVYPCCYCPPTGEYSWSYYNRFENNHFRQLWWSGVRRHRHSAQSRIHWSCRTVSRYWSRHPQTLWYLLIFQTDGYQPCYKSDVK